MMRTACTLLLLLFVTGADSSDGAVHLRYKRVITVPAGSSGQTCMAVPPEVFAHAAPDLADLRLYQGEREAPYSLLKALSGFTRVRTIVPLHNLGTVHGDVTFEADPPSSLTNDVTLEVATTDFLATVTVTGSHGEHGGELVKLGAFTIFDLSQQRLGRSTVLHLPANTFQHLRFQMHGHLAPADITGVAFQPGAPPAETPYLTAAASTAIRRDGRQSIADISLPANVPVDRIRFVPGSAASAEFSRDVTVTVTAKQGVPPPNDEVPHALRYNGNIQRLHREEDGQRVDAENLSVDTAGTAENTETRWQITVENGDDVPLAIDAVQLQLRQRDLCFEGAGGEQYVLFYGDPAIHAPSYDYQRLFSAKVQPARATAGPEQLNTGYKPRDDSRPFTERHPALLWTGLLLAVGGLAGVALRSVRQVPPAQG